MGDPIVHFEANGPDGEALAAFYRDLFGWDLSKVEGWDYWLVDTRGGSGVNGGIGATQEGQPAYATFYVESDDPWSRMRRAVELGGTEVLPVTETPMVTFGQFTDPEGHIVGLVLAAEAPDGTPAGPTEGDGAPVDWFEVLGADASGLQRFYAELFGWKVDDAGFPGYAMSDGTTSGIGGGIGSGDGASWATVYAKVADVDASLQRALELGATKEYGPNSFGGTLRTAAFRDPAGNVFGIYSGSAQEQ